MLWSNNSGAIQSDANDASASDAIDPVVTSSSDTAKNMADGGYTAGNPSEMDPGVKDASVNDFLGPLLAT